MLHLIPKFNPTHPSRIWYTDSSAGAIPSLAMTALLTLKSSTDSAALFLNEARPHVKHGFWGRDNFGSNIPRMFLPRERLQNASDDVPRPNPFTTVQIDTMRQEIEQTLQFLKQENLAQSVTVDIEAKDERYHITVTIDEHIIQI